MKWDPDNLEFCNIPEDAKLFLVNEGIDIGIFVFPIEFYDGCLIEDKLCIGEIADKFLVIDSCGKLFLLGEHIEIVPVAETLHSFIKMNEYLSKINFSSKVNWELIINDLNSMDAVFIESSFWRELVEYLYDFST